MLYGLEQTFMVLGQPHGMSLLEQKQSHVPFIICCLAPKKVEKGLGKKKKKKKLPPPPKPGGQAIFFFVQAKL